MEMAKLTAILLVLVVLGGLPAQADMTSIKLTSDALGLGSVKINDAGNDTYVEGDRPGKLVTSTADNIGSVLYIQSNNLAGGGSTTDPAPHPVSNLVTVTARSHMDVQDDLPENYDVHAGVITLTSHNTSKDELSKEGLGVRAFAIDSSTGRRYDDGEGKGFITEGSKHVSGGVDVTSWLDFLSGNPSPPHNSPPHVDEDVLFNFNNDLFFVAADSVKVLLTDIKAGSGPFDLALDLTIDLVGGSRVKMSYDYLSDAPDVFSLYSTYDNVIEVDFSGDSLGLSSTDLIDSFIIGARDDPADGPKETDEHFFINGFIHKTFHNRVALFVGTWMWDVDY